MTPQQFIREVEKKYIGQFGQHGGSWIYENAKVFFRSQLSRLLEELEKEMPEEEKIQKYIQTEVSYVEGYNACHKSMLSTIKEWKEGIKN